MIGCGYDFVSVAIIVAVVVVVTICDHFALCGPPGGLPRKPRAWTWGLQIASPVPGRVRIFQLALGFGMIFRAAFPHPHWLSQWHNYDHIPQAAGSALCLLVVKDLLSIHQPPLFFFFANYISSSSS